MGVYLGSTQVDMQGGFVTGGASGVSLQSKTVSPSESAQTIKADNGYDGLSQVTVNAVSRTYVGSGVTKKSAATYTPGTSDQSIASGQYLNGTQTIKGDSNLTAGNIRSGVKIFNVTGSYAGSSSSGGTDTSDADATASDIAKGKTAYVNGEKVTGTLTDSTVSVEADYDVVDSAQISLVDESPKSKATSFLTYTTDASGSSRAILDNSRENTFGIDVRYLGRCSPDYVLEGYNFSGYYTETSPSPSYSYIYYRGYLNQAGTMTNNGAWTSTIAPGASVTIPAGYHNGRGSVTASGSSSGVDTSDATATAANILSGKTAYVNGSKLTGTMTNNGAVSKTMTANGSYTIPAGYHNGSGKVTVNVSSSSGSSNNNIEAYAITNTNPSVSFKRTDGAIKIWGYGTMTSSSGWGGQTTSLIAFEGDRYYKSASWGSPSSTSLSLSISNGKLTGLPSELSAISAIVTRGI